MARAAATRKKLPTHVYDFTSGSLTPWRGDWAMTYSRTGSQYSLDSDGWYSAKATNTPAFSYGKGLLLEEARTNVYHNSDDMSNAKHSSSTGYTITTDQANFIDNTAIMDLCTDSGTAVHTIGHGYATTSFTGLFEMYVRKGTSAYAALRAGGGANFAQMNIDFQAMAVYSTATTKGGTGDIPNYGIDNMGNDIYRLWAYVTAVGNGTNVFPSLNPADTYAHILVSYAALGQTCYACGGGLYENASYPLSHVPNTADSGTSTRAAPTCSSTLPNYVKNNGAFSLYIDVYKLFAGTTNKIGTPAIFELKKDSNNYFTVLLNQTTANAQQKLVLSGASDFGTDASLSWNRNQLVRYMVTFDGTSTWKIYANGSLLRTDTATGNLSPTTLELAKTISTMYGGFIYRKVAIWDFAHNATDAAAYTLYGW